MNFCPILEKNKTFNLSKARKIEFLQRKDEFLSLESDKHCVEDHLEVVQKESKFQATCTDGFFQSWDCHLQSPETRKHTPNMS